MENTKVTKNWGIAAIVAAAVIIIAGAALLLMVPARAQQPPACCPAVIVQWQPQSILEAKFRARVIEDNVMILKGLKAIAANPAIGEKEFADIIGKTYFRTPRVYTSGGWIEGVPGVLAWLKETIKPRSQPTITSVSVVINYEPYAGAKGLADDIDASATIVFTFSASPDGYQGAGTLRHSRICEVI
jgi:hypothetical protein